MEKTINATFCNSKFQKLSFYVKMNNNNGEWEKEGKRRNKGIHDNNWRTFISSRWKIIKYTENYSENLSGLVQKKRVNFLFTLSVCYESAQEPEEAFSSPTRGARCTVSEHSSRVTVTKDRKMPKQVLYCYILVT